MTNEKLNTGDVFRSFLVENADYDGDFELPKIKTSSLIPEKYNRLWQRTGQHFQAVQGYGDKRRSVGKRFFQESRAGQA